MRIISLVLVTVFSLFSRLAEADELPQADAKAWLAAARQAMSHLNYRGTATYLKDNRLESFKVYHRMSNGNEQERLLSTNTPMREVVRNGEKVTCYFPDFHTISISVDNKLSRNSFLFSLPSDLGDLSRQYAFTLGDVVHVAQRPARLVSIEPLDDNRYGRRLWIDVESKLPLKYEMLDEHREVVEQMVFNTLSIEASIEDKELAASTVTDDSWQVKQHESLQAVSLKWALDGVPDGFRLISYTRLKKGPDNNRTIDHILLSDGFSSVSIYIDEVSNKVFSAQPRKVGAINSYSRQLDGYLVTVMGEAPEKTVQSIGNGIRLQDNNAK